MSRAASQIAIRHFGRKVVSSLASKGISIVGTVARKVTWGSSASFGYVTDYQIDDNGCGRIRSLEEVQAMA